MINEELNALANAAKTDNAKMWEVTLYGVSPAFPKKPR